MRWTNCMRWNSFHHLRWEWPILARCWSLPHAPPNPVGHLAPAWGPGTCSLSDDICINPTVWRPDSLPVRVCSFSGGFIFSSLSRSLLEESRCTTLTRPSRAVRRDCLVPRDGSAQEHGLLQKPSSIPGARARTRSWPNLHGQRSKLSPAEIRAVQKTDLHFAPWER